MHPAKPIAPALPAGVAPWPSQHEHSPELPSTNSTLWAKLTASPALPPGYWLTTDYQTAGRGQYAPSAGKSAPWHASKALNLLGSVLLKPSSWPQALPSDRLFTVTQAASLALQQVLTAVLGSGAEVCIKWPNDVLVNGHKIAGLLQENQLEGHSAGAVVMGLGLNVNERAFPPELNATSVLLESGQHHSPQALGMQWLRAFQAWCQLAQQGPAGYAKLRQYYTSQLYRLDTWALFADALGEFQGCIVGVTPEGQLRITRKGGLQQVIMPKELVYLGA